MGIAKDPTTHRQLVVGRHILDLVQGKVLARHLDIMESELRGKTIIVMEEAGRETDSGFLGATGRRSRSERCPANRTRCDRFKKQAKVDYNVMFAAFDARFGTVSDPERALVTYDQVQEGWWNKTARSTIRRFCEDWACRIPTKPLTG